jgi:FlaA1/EpsC-like NDP-sugar epimerase
MNNNEFKIQNSCASALSSRKLNIVLIGGGGHCHSVIDVIEQENKYEIIGIVDTKENIGKKVLDYEIIACDDDLEELFKTCKKAVITIGHIKTNQLRKKLFEKAKNIGFDFPISEIVSQEIMSLPMNPYLTDEEIAYIVENL